MQSSFNNNEPMSMEGLLEIFSNLKAGSEKFTPKIGNQGNPEEGSDDYIKKCIRPASPILQGLDIYKYNPVLQNLIYQLYRFTPVTRSVRGDGNCFYRSVGLLIVEYTLLAEKGKELMKNIIEIIEKNESFFDIFEETVPGFEKNSEIYDCFVTNMKFLVYWAIEKSLFCSDFENLFNNSEFDTAVVALVRCLVWSAISFYKNNPSLDTDITTCLELFKNEFSEVRVMGKEAEQITINILAKFLNIKINVFYIESKQQDPNNSILIFDSHFKSEKEPSLLEIDLFYKPGHYEVLYNEAYSKKMYSNQMKENEDIEQQYMDFLEGSFQKGRYFQIRRTEPERESKDYKESTELNKDDKTNRWDIINYLSKKGVRDIYMAIFNKVITTFESYTNIDSKYFSRKIVIPFMKET